MVISIISEPGHGARYTKEKGHMDTRKFPLTMGGRVNETILAKVDAASLLTKQSRSQFVVSASLRAAEQVLRDAVDQGNG